MVNSIKFLLNRNKILKQDQGTWFMTDPTEEGRIRTDHIQSLCWATPIGLANTFIN